MQNVEKDRPDFYLTMGDDFSLDRLVNRGTYTAVLVLAQGGNDVWFGSASSSQPPQLAVTAEDPTAR
jgi:hypothetical protein